MKSNVLHLIPSFNQGGSERQALQLMSLLIEDGTYNIKLATLDRNGILFPAAQKMGFDWPPEFQLTSFFDLNMFRQLRRFVSFLKEEKIDIVQTHDFYSNIFGMTGARIAATRVRIAAKRETGMRTTAQKFIERRAFSFADAVIVNSERVMEYLNGSGVPRKKLEVIYNGVDHRRFDIQTPPRRELAASFNLPADSDLRIITIVANLRDRVKNHEMFLKAAAKIHREVDDAAFIIAGEGELLEQTKRLAHDLGISARTFFIGPCSRVPELLAFSDICVLTSDSEGFSNSLIEYMAAAKPVIATNVGGAGEAIVDGKTGYLIAAGDTEALAKRSLELLNDRRKAQQMGKDGRMRVAERFSAETQLRKTISVYERELSKKSRSAN